MRQEGTSASSATLLHVTFSVANYTFRMLAIDETGQLPLVAC